jgi:hypothetical protein
MPHPSKSRVLRVATAAPRARAMAAICASNAVTGRPAARLAAATCGKACAASTSKGRMRPAKSSVNTASTAARSASRRFPRGRTATPYRTSACVIVVMKSLDAGWRPSHRITWGDGAALIISEITFVSTIITCQIEEPGESVPCELQAGPNRQGVRISAGWIEQDPTVLSLPG